METTTTIEEKNIEIQDNNKNTKENTQQNAQEFLEQIEKIDNSSKNNSNQTKTNNQNNTNIVSSQSQNNTSSTSTNDNLKARIVKKNSLDADVTADLRNPMSDSTQTRIVEKNNLEGNVIADLRETVNDFREDKPKVEYKTVFEIIKPNMLISNSTISEGDISKFDITFDKASNRPFKVTFSPLLNGTATLDDINFNITVKDSKGNILVKETDGYSIPVGEVNLKVEIQTNNDSNTEGNETFSLIAKTEFMTTSLVGKGTIADDGSLSNGLNDDRALSVNSVVVNEGSPYAVFEVSGAANQLASLSLANQNNDGSNLSNLQYFDGISWISYTSGNVTLDNNGKLLVRVSLSPEQESIFDGPETFNLVATNTGGISGSGLGTIKDDGIGSYFAENNNTKDSNIPNGIVLDDDRGINVTSYGPVNESSTYAMFEITGSMVGESLDLTLQNATSGTQAMYSGFTTVQYSIDGGGNWTTYDSSHKPVVPNDGNVFVRVNITSESDSTYEGTEKFALKANYTNYTSINSSADTSIVDDGTGSKYIGTVTSVTPNSNTISLDDDKPTLTLLNGTVEEGSTIVFSGSLSKASEYAEDITLSSTLGTAEIIDYNQIKTTWTVTYNDGTDHTLSVDVNGKFTLPAGITSFNVNIPTTSDNIYEGAETFTLLANATSSYITDSDTASGTITDDGTVLDGDDIGLTVDNDKPQMTISDVTVEEGSGATFTVTVGVSETPYKVTFNTSVNGSSEVEDITSPIIVKVGNTVIIANQDGSYTVPANTTSLTVTVPTVNDNVYEVSEAFELNGKTEFMVSDVSGIGTIKDDGTGVDGDDVDSLVDNDKPTVSIGVSPVGVSEEDTGSGNSMTYTVSLSNTSAYDTKVYVSLSGTATSTADYTTSGLSTDANGTYITITAGQTTANFTATTVVDTKYEGAETVIATISNPTTNNETLTITTSSATGRIYDDGSSNGSGGNYETDKPTVSIGVSPVGVSEEDTGSGNSMTYTVSLSNTSAYDTKVYVSLSGTATSTADYTTSGLSTDANGTYITITAGQTTANFTATTVVDTKYEGVETVIATISNPTTNNETLTITTSSATGRIYDDGSSNGSGGNYETDKPTLTLSDGTVEEGSTIVFSASLSNPSAYAEDITLSITLGTAETTDYNQTKTTWTVTYNDGTDHTLSVDANGKFTLPAGVTSFNVNIPTTNDNVYEGSETFTLSANATSSYITDSDTASGSITDKPTTTNDSITINEDTTYTFTVNDFGTFGTLDTGISLTKVKILTLPIDGVIELNGIAINANDEILLSDISSNKLTFVPNSETDNDSSFTFQVGNATAYSNTQTTTVNIIAVADTPTTTLSVSAYSGSYVTNSASVLYASATSTTINTNDTTTATFSNIKTGVVYSTSFNYIDASSTIDSGKVDVYWGNQLVTTIDGDNTMSRTATFDLIGGAGDGLNQLKFVASGTETNVNGVQISNIYMAPAENMLEYNIDLSAALNTADRTDGSENLVIKLSGYAIGTTFSVGYAETSSQLDVVLNINTLQPTGNWIIPLSAITDNTFINNSIKMYVPESADTFTLTSTAYAIDNDNSITPSTDTSTVTDYSLNTAPTSTTDSISVIEDTTYVLKVNDFGTYSDVDNNAFTSVKITSLPIHGVIRLLGHDKMGTAANISAGDEILVSDLNLGNLIYIPNSQYSGADTFNFKVGDGRSFSLSSYTTTVGVTAVADMPTISLNIGTATLVSTGSNNVVTESFGTNSSSNIGTWSNINYNSDNSDRKADATDGVTSSNSDTGYVANIASNTTATVTYSGFTANSTVTIKFSSDAHSSWTGTFTIKDTVNNTTIYQANSKTDFDSDKTNSIYNSSSITAHTDSTGHVSLSFQNSSSGNIDIDQLVITETLSSSSTYNYPITITDVLGVDKDGSETLGNVTLSGIPTGSSLYANGTLITVTTNTATLTQSQITAGNIILKIPSTDSQAFSLSASVTSTESSNSDSKTATAIAEHVTGNTTPVTTNLIADLVTTSSVATNTPTNIIVIMDVSGSMSTTDSGTSGSRLSLAKSAINSMIDAYSAIGTVNVNLTSFQATATSYGWKNATDAKAAITALASGGYTNYEDALYKTYSTYTDINSSAKTIVLFVSDGEPTRENLEGRDVTGDIGLDAQSGWLDSTYKTAWQTFVNANIDELKVVGIGSGLTNTTYLSQVAEGINTSVMTDVVHLKNTADLSSYVAPNVDSISGNVLSNIDYKADGAGGIKSIIINGTTYHSNVSSEVTALSNGVNTASSGSYGKLTFDFTTGDYKYTTVTSTTADRSESFAITVADSNNDTSTFNLNIQVFSNVSEYTYANTAYDAGSGFDSLILGNGINMDFNSSPGLSNFEQIDLTKNANHSLSNIELQDILDITDSNHLFRVLGDSGDSISLKNTVNATWSKNGSTDINGFDTYINNGNNTISLKIDSDMSVSIA